MTVDSAYMNQKKSKFKSKKNRISHFLPVFRWFYPEKHKILILIYKLFLGSLNELNKEQQQ